MLGDPFLVAFDAQDGGARTGLSLDLSDLAPVGKMLGDIIRRLRTIQFVRGTDVHRRGDAGVIGIDDRQAGVLHLLDRRNQVRCRFRRQDEGAKSLAEQSLGDGQLLSPMIPNSRPGP